MKLEKKLGIYLTTIILLAIIGFGIMLYPFEFYSELDKMKEGTETSLMIIVFGTKAIGVGLLFLGSEMYHKHFKDRNYDEIN
tara:strand:+ start:29504 stop:29749 length:246 start_codon:yes stop_codon:yes gene_type:complete